jgi:hypothetical protein
MNRPGKNPIPNYTPLEHLPVLCTTRREFLEKTAWANGAMCLASIFGTGVLTGNQAEAAVIGAKEPKPACAEANRISRQKRSE